LVELFAKKPEHPIHRSRQQKLCIICQKPISPTSDPRRIRHRGECTLIYARQKTRAWLQKKRQLKSNVALGQIGFTQENLHDIV